MISLDKSNFLKLFYFVLFCCFGNLIAAWICLPIYFLLDGSSWLYSFPIMIALFPYFEVIGRILTIIGVGCSLIIWFKAGDKYSSFMIVSTVGLVFFFWTFLFNPSILNRSLIIPGAGIIMGIQGDQTDTEYAKKSLIKNLSRVTIGQSKDDLVKILGNPLNKSTSEEYLYYRYSRSVSNSDYWSISVILDKTTDKVINLEIYFWFD